MPLGILAAVLTWRSVPEPAHLIRRDARGLAGTALLIVGIGALQILLERGESKDWFESREIVVEAIAAVVGLSAFVWHELRAAQSDREPPHSRATGSSPAASPSR